MIPKSYVESLAVSPEIVEEDLAVIDVGDLVDWTRVQALDSNIRQCIEYLQANKKPHKKERLWYHGIANGLDGLAGNCTSF
jgi:hypothetical protein